MFNVYIIIFDEFGGGFLVTPSECASSDTISQKFIKKNDNVYINKEWYF